MTPRYRVRIGDTVMYVTTKQQCVDGIEQLEYALAQMGNLVEIKRPNIVDGYISREEFQSFIHQLTPAEDTRRGSTGGRIFVALVRAALSGSLGLEVHCGTRRCGRNIREACGYTHKPHSADGVGVERFSIKMASLMANASSIRRQRGITPEYYKMIQELISFA